MRDRLHRFGEWILDRLVRFVLGPVLGRAGVRVYQANLHRIGDTTSEVGLYLEMRRLGWRPREHAIVIPPPRKYRLSNPVLLDYLGRQVRIVGIGRAYPLLFRLASHGRTAGGPLDAEVVSPDGLRLGEYQALVTLTQPWEEQGLGPLLRLDPEHEERGRAALARLGVGENEWFVCLHAREGGFLNEGTTSKNRHLNVDVMTYLPAVRTVLERGGRVVRVGDASMKPLPPLDGVVDYAHSPDKSADLDVFLAAACRFWLGTNSGYFIVAWAFGVPVLLTNVAPMSWRPWGSRDLYVPKLYRRPQDGRLVPFERALRPDLYYARDVHRLGIEFVDNEPGELAEATAEMLDVLDGRRPDARVEALRDRFDRLAPYYPRGATSRIAAGFLVRHEHLMPPLLEASAGGR
jgi:putative glycosyltransferase (TIGR04372 family)